MSHTALGQKTVLSESFISDGTVDHTVSYRWGSFAWSICVCLYLDAGEHGVPSSANQSGGQ